MSGCGRQFCESCNEELIHRDHRKGYESASALGQIVWREGPTKLSVTDLDLVSRKGMRNGSTLLRLVEQKNPNHSLDDAQERTLTLLDGIIGHCQVCPTASGLRLNERSGVYIIRGEISAATNGRKKTQFAGPQEIERLRLGERRILNSHEDFFRFLDPEDLSRRRRMMSTD